MKHSDKPAGMTLAEALGIVVPDDAPGGAALFPVVRAGRQHNSNAADSMAKDIEYEGFHDVDGYGRSYD